MNEDNYQVLLSDEVFATGVAASDMPSLWRALARSASARKVARGLASEPARIRGLCRFLEHLLEEPYERGFRHPHDIAVCAALVILEQSPLSEARNLFARLKSRQEPSLVWVRRMAAYCDERFQCAQLTEYAGTERIATRPDTSVKEAGNGPWSDPRLGNVPYSLHVVSA
jgi:hypothetical protein